MDLFDLIALVGLFVGSVGGGLSVLFLMGTGIQYMTSQGDPAALGRAKLSGIGVLIGLVIIGTSFLVPAAVDRIIVRPVGGVSVSENLSSSCDGMFRSRLVADGSAHDAESMRRLVSDIQATVDECGVFLWSPRVVDLAATQHSNDCFGGRPRNTSSSLSIGGQQVPRSFRSTGGLPPISRDSGRDEVGNILVYFSNSLAERPSDNSACWFYHSRNGAWSEQ